MSDCYMGLESTTSRVKEEGPGVVGVPEITPLLVCSINPVGRLPL